MYKTKKEWTPFSKSSKNVEWTEHGLKQMKKVRIIALFLLLSLLPVYSLASDVSGRTLVLEMQDGQLINYVLNEEPKISFAGNEVVITTNEQIDVRLLFTNIRKYYFVNTSTGIVSESTHKKIFVSMSNGKIMIYNAPVNSELYVYKADGCEVNRHRVGVDGKISFSLDEYASGVYVVKVGSFSYKFAK